MGIAQLHTNGYIFNGKEKETPGRMGWGEGGIEGIIIHECGADGKNRPDIGNFLLTILERTKSLKPFRGNNHGSEMLQYHNLVFSTITPTI